MQSTLDAWRRWLGAFFLLFALGMVMWGMLILGSFLVAHPVFFLIYWSVCFLCTFLAMAIALWDLRVIRQRSRVEQENLFRQSFSERSDTEEGSGRQR